MKKFPGSPEIWKISKISLNLPRGCPGGAVALGID